ITPNTLEDYNKFGGAFWVGFVFINLAFIGQLAVAFFAFKAKNLERFFLNISLIRISYSGLIAMLIVGVAAMLIPNLPPWLGALLCLIVLAFTAVAVVKAGTAADIVEEVGQKVKEQTFFIKSLTVDAQTLVNSVKTPQSKALAQKIYEAIRYSDPMSSDALSADDGKIALAFENFSKALKDDSGESQELSEELLVLIKARNEKCKLLK
ncbi:MAG TPA: hypothetical protein PKW24_03560, partial [Clostridiales bacterium]|nr:hypothetical protein [Clostridiales bacterium]